MAAIEALRTDLERLRDEAKVQAHLAGMEARDQWDALEKKWNHFSAEARLHQSGEAVKATLGELGQELRAAYEQLKTAV